MTTTLSTLSDSIAPERSGKEFKSRIPELDGLRGLAILLVIICHYVGNADHAPLGFWIHRMLSAFAAGWSGVDLFFVLSGFLIGGILFDARTAPHYFRAFYMRRAYRILPIYYLWILIYGLLVGGALWFWPAQQDVVPHDLIQVPLHIFFLQNLFIGMPPLPWIWFVVTWSLAVEEQFYLLCPLLIRFFSFRRMVIILVAIILAAPVLRFMLYRISGNQFIALFPMPCRADALAWGILLALAWRQSWFRSFLEKNRLLLQRVLLVLLSGVGVLLWWLARPAGIVTLTIGVSWLALFSGCLLLVVLSQTEGWLAGCMRWRVLRKLGEISYCVYILHLTFNHLAHRLLLHASPEIYNLKGVGATLLAGTLTIVVAKLSWRYFEKPLIQRGHRYLYRDGAAI